MIERLSTEELLALQKDSAAALDSLIETIGGNEDLQEVLLVLSTGGNILDTIARLTAERPDVTQDTLEACLTATLNVQWGRQATKELKRRAADN